RNALDHPDWAHLALTTDAWVCVVRREHPVVRSRLELEEFAACSHVAWPGEPARVIAAQLEVRGRSRSIGAQVADAWMAAQWAASSDCVAIVPSRVADRILESHELRLFSPPVAAPVLTTELCWSPLQSADPVLEWV